LCFSANASLPLLFECRLASAGQHLLQEETTSKDEKTRPNLSAHGPARPIDGQAQRKDRRNHDQPDQQDRIHAPLESIGKNTANPHHRAEGPQDPKASLSRRRFHRVVRSKYPLRGPLPIRAVVEGSDDAINEHLSEGSSTTEVPQSPLRIGDEK
jgi:hypothetical protein